MSKLLHAFPAPTHDPPLRAGSGALEGREARRWWPELLAGLLVVLLTVAIGGSRLDSDVSWQLWVAHHLDRGARFGIDIVETNPPLWFWMALPIDRLAALLGQPAAPLLVAAVGCTALGAIVATGRLLVPLPPLRRLVLLCYAAPLVMIMPALATGQREQLALLAALPYAALAARRRAGMPIAWPAAFLVGSGAAIGFLLKHYFLIVPGLLELWLQVAPRRRAAMLRPELVALLAGALLYLVAIAVFSPDYLTHVAPMVRLAYGQASVASAANLIQPTQIIWLLSAALFAAAGFRRREGGASFGDAAAVAAAGFAAAWLIQHKGWPYHAIATTGCLSLALAARLAEGRRVPMPVRLVAPAVLALPIALTLVVAGVTARAKARPDLDGLRPGDAVAFLSSEPAWSWPAVSERGLRYPLRYNGFWMLHAIAAARGRPDPGLQALADEVRAETARDLRCAAPRRLVFDRPGHSGSAIFDTYAFFMQDPAFRATMASYRHRFATGDRDVFDRVAPLPPIPPALCRTGV